jgi:hypothetical protein
MKKPTCETCPWWQDNSERFENDGMGQCRKTIPNPFRYGSIKTDPDIETESYWPICPKGAWCGEHPDFPAYLESLKEEKGD